MGKEEIKNQATNLYVQLIISSKLLTEYPSSVTFKEIIDTVIPTNIDEQATKTALAVMISHGLITHSFKEKDISYCLTEFGNYFFEQLRNENCEIDYLFKG